MTFFKFFLLQRCLVICDAALFNLHLNQYWRILSLGLNFQSRLWLWLAETQKELGLNIPDEAIAQMRSSITMTDEDFEVASIEEK